MLNIIPQSKNFKTIDSLKSLNLKENNLKYRLKQTTNFLSETVFENN